MYWELSLTDIILIKWYIDDTVDGRLEKTEKPLDKVIKEMQKERTDHFL